MSNYHRRDNDIFGTGPSQENNIRKTQNQNRRDNDIFGTGPSQEDHARKGHVQNRNASSFNIIGFDPSAQTSNRDDEQLSKKEKQDQYRYELNQMVNDKKDKKNVSDQYGQGRGNYGDEYSAGGNDYGSHYNVGGGSYNKQHQQYQSNPYSQEVDRYSQQQQDYRQQADDQRASTEQEKKRRLQMEMLNANKQAIEAKQAEKKRQSVLEAAEDSRRLQDSLHQFERDDYRQKESKKRLQEDNAKVLNQQRVDFNHRKDVNMDNMDIGEPLRERPQAMPSSQYSGHNQDYSSMGDYQKNRERNRHGNSYNIISNEYN